MSDAIKPDKDGMLDIAAVLRSEASLRTKELMEQLDKEEKIGEVRV